MLIIDKPNQKTKIQLHKLKNVRKIEFIRIIFLTFYLLCTEKSFNQVYTYNITIKANDTTGPVKPVWSYFGYDEAGYTYMKDGRKLLSELGTLSHAVPVYVRVHNLLTSGNGIPALKWSSTNAYTEDAAGNPIYNWKIVDSIFDVFVKNGIRPVVEIGFMPEALSVRPLPYQHHWKPGMPYDSIYTGWAYPPKDYSKWAELVYKWVKHCLDRYGENEVKNWYWEVWNEPNIGYWKGTLDEYFKLYDFAADAVKRAYPKAKIGGPTTTGPRWDKAAAYLTAFLEHCANGKNYVTGTTGSPLDYITFHAKGDPSIIHDHVVMNLAVQLQDVAKGFEIIQHSAFANLPIIIGEFDPEGCAACSVEFNPQNAYRNGTMYSSYTAASFTQLYALAKQYKINLEGAVSWSFEFENQPWFAGFRDLATNGVDKPVLNVFRMFAMMKGQLLQVTNKDRIPVTTILDSSVRADKPFVDAFATRDKNNMYVLLWNYHDDNSRQTPVAINVLFKEIRASVIKADNYLIDSTHSNPYTLWKKMGSPQEVNAQQFHELEKAGMLQKANKMKQIKVQNGNVDIPVMLRSQAVCLLHISW
jgi:xylan 1,4-beta-xylosidase